MTTSARLDILVRTIVAATAGNQALARKTLIEKVLDDERLLRELVAPFLPAIALKKIQQVSASRGGQGSAGRGAVSPVASSVRSARPMVGRGGDRDFPIGRPELVSALSSGGKGRKGKMQVPQAGYNPMAAKRDDAAQEDSRRVEASSRHVNTMKMLAAVYAAKRGERV